MLLETKHREKYETGNVGYAYEIWRHGLPSPRIELDQNTDLSLLSSFFMYFKGGSKVS